jgi:hypothetical protein
MWSGGRFLAVATDELLPNPYCPAQPWLSVCQDSIWNRNNRQWELMARPHDEVNATLCRIRTKHFKVFQVSINGKQLHVIAFLRAQISDFFTLHYTRYVNRSQKGLIALARCLQDSKSLYNVHSFSMTDSSHKKSYGIWWHMYSQVPETDVRGNPACS